MFVGAASNIILSFQAFRSCSLPHTDAIIGVMYHLIESSITTGRRAKNAQLACGDSATQKTNAHV